MIRRHVLRPLLPVLMLVHAASSTYADDIDGKIAALRAFGDRRVGTVSAGPIRESPDTRAARELVAGASVEQLAVIVKDKNPAVAAHVARQIARTRPRDAALVFALTGDQRKVRVDSMSDTPPARDRVTTVGGFVKDELAVAGLVVRSVEKHFVRGDEHFIVDRIAGKTAPRDYRLWRGVAGKLTPVPLDEVARVKDGGSVKYRVGKDVLAIEVEMDPFRGDRSSASWNGAPVHPAATAIPELLALGWSAQ